MSSKHVMELSYLIIIIIIMYYYFLWFCSPARAMASSSTRFLDHTQRRATVGWTPMLRFQRLIRDLRPLNSKPNKSSVYIAICTFDTGHRPMTMRRTAT
jgi:hypothetical protein